MVWVSSVARAVSVAGRVLVVRSVVVRGPVVRSVVPVWVARVGPVVRVVPGLTVSRVWVRWGHRGLLAVRVVRVARVVQRGPVGCVVMVAGAGLVVWVGVVVMGR